MDNAHMKVRYWIKKKIYIYSFCFVSLQKCMKSKNNLLKGIACYTYTYMQLYTLCAGWFYLLEMRWGSIFCWRSLFLKCSCVRLLSETIAKYCISETILPYKQQFVHFNKMRNGDSSSNVYRSFLVGSDSYLEPIWPPYWSMIIRFCLCKHEDNTIVDKWTSSCQIGFLCTGIPCVDDRVWWKFQNTMIICFRSAGE